MTYQSEVLADAPLAYYRLNETTGTTAVDSSGNGRDATYKADTSASTSGFTLGVAGAVPGDTAITLASASKDWVDLTNDAWTQSGTGSYELWFKSTATGSFLGMVIKQGSQGVFLSSGKIVVYDWSTAGTGATAFTSTASYNNGNWHHLVLTFQGGVTNGSTVYVDGAALGSFTINSVSAQTIGLSLGSGTGLGGAPQPTQYFPGSLDEAAIYGSVLPAARVADHYTVGTGGALAVKVAGDPWVGGAGWLDGAAKVALRVAGESWAAPAAWLVGGIPVTTPVLIAGSPWAAPATLLDGLGRLQVAGETWADPAVLVDGTLAGQPVVVLGETWAAPAVQMDGRLRFLIHVGTSKTNRGNGIRLTGSAVVNVETSTDDTPPGLTQTPIPVVTPVGAAPTLVDGRPQ